MLIIFEQDMLLCRESITPHKYQGREVLRIIIRNIKNNNEKI